MLRWVSAAAVLGLLAWAADAAIASSRAETYVSAAKGEIASWAASGGAVDEPAWKAAHDKLSQAVGVDSRDPAAHELLGVLESGRLDRRDYVTSGLGRLRQSLRMRPASPYGWTNLARSEYAAGNIGAGFEVALLNAAAQGPNESEVRAAVVDLGLATWNEVAAQTRRSIDLMLRNSMKSDAAQTLRVAQRRGRLGLACRHLAGSSLPSDAIERQLCQREATS
jgi:hypothetical protein